MSELTDFLGLYKGDFKKFDKAVKKASNKKLRGGNIIFSARETLLGYEAELKKGSLRVVKTTEDILKALRLGKYLIGKEVYRIWSGGKNGKICSKVEVKGLRISEDGVVVDVQAGYSSGAKHPVIRTLELKDLDTSWFLSENDCKEAISKM